MQTIESNWVRAIALAACALSSASAQEIGPLAKELAVICGSKLHSTPKVVTLSEVEFNRRMRECDAGLGDRDSSPVSTFYDAGANTIVRRESQRWFDHFANTGHEVEMYERMELFHELVHAWQYQEHGSTFQRLKGHESILHALKEGHAEYCLRKYCARMGAERLHQRLADGLMKRFDVLGGVREADYFTYVESMRFFAFLAQHNPPILFADVLKRPLPTEYEIVFPNAYVEGPRIENVRPSAWIGFLASIKGTEHVTAAVCVSNIGFRAFRLSLRQVCPTAEIRNELERGFVEGSRFAGKGVDIACIQFDTAERAGIYFDYVRRKCEYLTSISVPVQRVQDDAVRYFITANETRKDVASQSVLLLHDGRTISTVTYLGGAEGGKSASALADIPRCYVRAKLEEKQKP